jgi:hypothetical protein
MTNTENGPPPKSEIICAACGNHVEVGARFCWACGRPVAPEPEPELEEVVVYDDDEIPLEALEEPRQERTYEDVVVVPERTERAERPKPAERTERMERMDRRRPASSDPLSSLSWLPPVAAGFAVFALLIALLVHALAPSAVAGYSPAELDLKVQMRAVTWLLAGILVALVGILAKR